MIGTASLLYTLLALSPMRDEDALPPTGYAPSRIPDVVYVPTATPLVDLMLEMAEVGPDDVLYDLGSGDGRIPIAAAVRWGTRGVGIELKPDLVAEASLAAMRAGVSDKVRFHVADLFDTDITPATVVTLYLLPELNMRLRERLQRMPAGTRIVSHDYHMGDWAPDRVEKLGGSTLYLWVVR